MRRIREAISVWDLRYVQAGVPSFGVPPVSRLMTSSRSVSDSHWARLPSRDHAESVAAAHSVRAVLGIFYFVMLLPMRKRQQKVQEFLAALKVGDKVITSGGIFGSITQCERSVGPAADRQQRAHRGLSCGDRRISRGRNRSSPEAHTQHMMKNMQLASWRLIAVVIGAFRVGILSARLRRSSSDSI